MTGTKEGGEQLRITMIEKHGSEEAWREWMSNNGRKGGAGGVAGENGKKPKGFALMNKEKVIEAGRKGGLLSKRGSRGV